LGSLCRATDTTFSMVNRDPVITIVIDMPPFFEKVIRV
jgi:hypothetical protein